MSGALTLQRPSSRVPRPLATVPAVLPSQVGVCTCLKCATATGNDSARCAARGYLLNPTITFLVCLLISHVFLGNVLAPESVWGPTITHTLSGAAGGGIATLVTHPFDAIKTKMQVRQEDKYRTIGRTVKAILQVGDMF